MTHTEKRLREILMPCELVADLEAQVVNQLEDLITQAEQEMLKSILEKVSEKVKEYHKDCFTDVFINGKFWAYKEMQEYLLPRQTN